jgi:hypothetical protein
LAADNDSAGRAEVDDYRSIIGSDQVAEGDYAVIRRMTLLVGVDFDRHRHTVQRSERVALCSCRVCRIGSD